MKAQATGDGPDHIMDMRLAPVYYLYLVLVFQYLPRTHVQGVKQSVCMSVVVVVVVVVRTKIASLGVLGP